ncbi:MAG: MerR family transcriptional regulator [Hyphomicrobiales bacterium]|nr:MerR family transcriptional regulator [Hyphomicrobiales bacterium]
MSSPETDKAPDAYRTISEVAEELDLPQHVLRFWETRFTQIRPMKRSGRRYYRREDIELVGAIKALLYGQGYTIKGVQRLLREHGARALAAHAQGEGQAGAEENETAEASDAMMAEAALAAPVAPPMMATPAAVEAPPVKTAPPPAPAQAQLPLPAPVRNLREPLMALQKDVDDCLRLLRSARA